MMDREFVIDFDWPGAMPAGAIEALERITAARPDVADVAVLERREEAPAFLRIRVVVQASAPDATRTIAELLVDMEDAVPSAHIARCARAG